MLNFTKKNIIATLRKLIISLPWFILIIGLFTGVLFTSLGYSKSDWTFSNFSQYKLPFHFILSVIAYIGVVALLALNRYIFAALFTPFILLCSLLCYYYCVLNISINPFLIDAILNTDPRTWNPVIPWTVYAITLTVIALSIYISFIRFKIVISTKRNISFSILPAIIIPLFILTIPQVRFSVSQRIPFNVIPIFKAYFDNIQQYPLTRNTYDHTPYSRDENPPDIIFIIGESVRADHLPMNGYHRNTFPLLSKDTLTVSFQNYHSYDAFTHICIPQMLTDISCDNLDKAYSEQSFITLFKKAGYSTIWIENQDTSIPLPYIYFAQETDSLSICFQDIVNNLDTDMLPTLKKWYSNNLNRPKLAILNTAGSHHDYRNHYTQKHRLFTPDGINKHFLDITNDEYINAYDNSLIATDEFINDIINLTDSYNTLIIYISDHGESLGEDGFHMHGRPSRPEQTNPAFFIRCSPEYINNFPETIPRLKSIKDKYFEPNIVFHSLLDLSHLNTTAFNASYSIIAGQY